MIVAGVAELKAKLSEYLARVRGGEEVLVTEHGRPVARIVGTESAEKRIADLERRGLIRPPRQRLWSIRNWRPRAPHHFANSAPPGWRSSSHSRW